jgi:hypothetical protein
MVILLVILGKNCFITEESKKVPAVNWCFQPQSSEVVFLN